MACRRPAPLFSGLPPAGHLPWGLSLWFQQPLYLGAVLTRAYSNILENVGMTQAVLFPHVSLYLLLS